MKALPDLELQYENLIDILAKHTGNDIALIEAVNKDLRVLFFAQRNLYAVIESLEQASASNRQSKVKFQIIKIRL
ncbi:MULTISPECIES: hypothetical protein [Pseudomonas]|uniref:hypothetical protein n=1 Tax=Pseudomonas TaxID=286 RepID=UPI00114C9412|nr:hypothetical protein [Pseudomonas sp. S3E12]